jgi:PKD repeat protein
MRSIFFTLLALSISTGLFATLDKKQVKIRITNPSGNIDETLIYLDQGISPHYNFPEDAQKILSNVPGVPVIFSITSDNYHCSINGFSTFTSSEIIPIGVTVDADGVYSLSSSLIDNFDETSIIQLEDRTLGVMHDLRTGAYSVLINITDAQTGRFFIHASKAATFSSTNADCTNNNGTISLDTDHSIVWDFINLYDLNNNLIQTYTNATGELTYNSLASGEYNLVFSRNNYNVTKSFTITGNYVVANINASALHVLTDQLVDFHAITTNANQYSWDFGDGTLIVGVANVENSYTFPGQYEVKLLTSNSFGCADQASITVTVDQATGVADPHQEEDNTNIGMRANNLNVSIATPTKATLSVYNIIGQTAYTSSIENNHTSVDLNTLPTGTYIASVTNNGKVTTKRIAIAH